MASSATYLNEGAWEPDAEEPSGVVPDTTFGLFADEQMISPEALIAIETLKTLAANGEEQAKDYSAVPFGDNLADHLEQPELQRLGTALHALFDDDLQSRREWEKTAADGVELLGLDIKPPRTDDDAPFHGASTVVDPVISEAIVRFQSNVIQEVFPANGPVDIEIMGRVDEAKRQRATRKREYMNHVLTTEIEDYREETEKLAWDLAYCGAAFRKIYREDGEIRPLYVPAERVIIPYNYPNLWKAPRFSLIVPMGNEEFKDLQERGVYCNCDLGDPVIEAKSDVQTAKDEVTKQSPPYLASSTQRELVEMYCQYRIPHFEDIDGFAPYIITYEKSSRTVVGIRRNWDQNDLRKKALQHVVQYTFIPGPGSYGFGYIHLLGNLAKSCTVLLRLLMDAGVLSTITGGLHQGLRTQEGPIRIKLGEYQPCEVSGTKLSDSLYTIPFKEPSGVLSALWERLQEKVRDMASIADPNIQASGETPVGTLLAMLEDKRKTLTAIQSRMHRSLKKEFTLFDRQIRLQLIERTNGQTDAEYPYDVVGGQRIVKLEDFMDTLSCRPVSDPNTATFGQQALKWKSVIDMAPQFPGVMDQKALLRGYLGFLNIKGVEEILPDGEHIPVRDPISEVQAILTGQPVKAFPWQDHAAHLAVIMGMIVQNPQRQEELKGMPQGGQIMAAATAAALERIGFIERGRIEKSLGFPLPPVGEPIPPEVEIAMSGAIARAAQKVFAQDVQQQRQKQLEDPVLQMQQQEQKRKDFEAQSDDAAWKAKLQADSRAKQERELTERMRIQANQQAKLLELQSEQQWVAMEIDKATDEKPLTSAQVAEIKARTLKIQAEISALLNAPRESYGDSVH